jgi:hypothetical protein
MRQPVVVGNWKMTLGRPDEALGWGWPCVQAAGFQTTQMVTPG